MEIYCIMLCANVGQESDLGAYVHNMVVFAGYGVTPSVHTFSLILSYGFILPFAFLYEWQLSLADSFGSLMALITVSSCLLIWLWNWHAGGIAVAMVMACLWACCAAADSETLLTFCTLWKGPQTQEGESIGSYEKWCSVFSRELPLGCTSGTWWSNALTCVSIRYKIKLS